MKKFIIRHIQSHLFKWGYQLRRIDRAKGPPPAYSHIKKALHGYDPDREVLNAVNCDLNQCVNLLGQVFGLQGWHPFTAALRDFATNKHTSYAGSVLEEYYDTFQPDTAKKVVLGEQPGPAELKAYCSAAAIEPWSFSTPEKSKKRVMEGMKRENKRAGKPLPSSAGFSGWGPVSPAKGRIEFNRLTDVYQSIKRNGYQRSGHWDGDIRGVALRRGDDVRFLIHSGHHRAAALAVLGDGTAPVRLGTPAIVEVRDVDMWNQVQKGVWDRESASRYFHSLFDFDGGRWARNYGRTGEKIAFAQGRPASDGDVQLE